jgi:hypothetical protein
MSATPALGPTQHLMQYIPFVLSLGLRGKGENSTLSSNSDGAKKTWIYISTPYTCLHRVLPNYTTRCQLCKRTGHVTTTTWYLVFLRSMRRLLVMANVPTSLILVSLMMEALSSSETSDLTWATRSNIPEDGILHSHLCENLRSYIALTGWAL